MYDVIKVTKYNARFGGKPLETELVEESADQFFFRIRDPKGNHDFKLSRADVATFAHLFLLAIGQS